MMYSEFITLTGYGESYITEKFYHDFIEPVYMNGDDDKKEFCEKFHALENQTICPAIECLISSNDTETLVDYINGVITFDEIQTIQNRMLCGFLKKFGRDGFEM